jgi:hypothetical protein
MLYDHASDPDENVNVVNNPKYREVVAKLQQILKDHRASL